MSHGDQFFSYECSNHIYSATAPLKYLELSCTGIPWKCGRLLKAQTASLFISSKAVGILEKQHFILGNMLLVSSNLK